MGILWLIIKIILFVLLALLSLIFLVLLIILISPITYEAYLEKYDELAYDFKFTYLGWIKGHFCLEKGYKNHEIKAFGKVLYEDKLKLKKEGNKEKTKVESLAKNKMKQDSKAVKKQRGHVQSIKRTSTKAARERVDEKNSKSYEKLASRDKKVDSETMEEIQETTEHTTHKVKRETKHFTKSLGWQQGKELICSKDFWGLVKEVWWVCKSLIKYIAPRKWSYELVIGREDPADTGELLAKLTLLYPLYYRHGIIRGDFENSGMWGGFLAQGHFSILGILKRIVIFLCRPVVRSYIKIILKIRKEEKHGEQD